ncbi:hypothetical protein [Streptomyces sp. enrichment culture]|uniref:hypothetical protein n=1 Tax=Streptomyces sp. enrichment culture TaxID=1795815 RepID=UPI003F55C017
MPAVAPQVVAYLVISGLAGIRMGSSVLSARSDLDQRVEEMRQALLPGLVPPDRRAGVTESLGSTGGDGV